ncbi:AAA family ATPase [Sphingobium sp. BHU LFT2]|uniref:replicative DNA helicase n=1 Tax=Sphingobium sp. BHU LFT2 TaxID=2807634 RepID=UPI001BEAF7D7|nr:DnaB-like helicase C-terminal domain-containing protein [Sphingobium sp. BHU LFT2]MBT2242662.1 AAA family ATPase [Sphingobium sp. BHU LFT2]
MTGALPSTADIEAGILAAIMTVDGGYDRAATKLRPDHFSEPLFARIFEQMARISAAGNAINILTVGNAMSAEPAYADLGGHGYWIRLANKPFTAGALAFIDELVASARRRIFIEAMDSARAAAMDLSVDIDAAMALAEQGVADCLPEEMAGKTARLGDAFAEAVDRVEALRRNEIAPGLMAYGWSDWNDLTGGIREGDYLLLAGRPSMGKTAVSLGVARRVAQAGGGVLYISREMTRSLLMERMVADLLFEAGGWAGMSDIKQGSVDEHDIAILRQMQAQVDALPLVIDDPEHLSITQIGPLVRKHRKAFERRGERLGLVVIDYLGLIDPPEGKGNREQEVSVISRTIKNMAKSMGIPFIVLSQLNRGVEQREDKRPQLSDLRDSGSLEQDADIVVFVYRDEYYLQRAEPDPGTKKHDDWLIEMQAARDRLDLYTAKNRNGDLQRRKGYFFGAKQAVRNSDYQRTVEGGPAFP